MPIRLLFKYCHSYGLECCTYKPLRSQVFCFPSQIFTEDLPEVEGLPRDKVLAHIEQCAKQLTIRYLVSRIESILASQQACMHCRTNGEGDKRSEPARSLTRKMLPSPSFKGSLGVKCRRYLTLNTDFEQSLLSFYHVNVKISLHLQEHIIFIWNELKPEFHNKLINSYRERVQVLMKEYLDSLPEGLFLF